MACWVLPCILCVVESAVILHGLQKTRILPIAQNLISVIHVHAGNITPLFCIVFYWGAASPVNRG